MRERKLEQAVNEATRGGSVESGDAAAETPSFPMGEPSRSLTKALYLAAELEDDELVRRLAARK